MRLRLILLSTLVLVISTSCFQSARDREIESDECVTQETIVNEVIVNGNRVDLTDEGLKPKYSDGIYYFENMLDEPPGEESDPVFAILGVKVIKAARIRGAWQFEHVSLAYLTQFRKIDPVGQFSDFNDYLYNPLNGEIKRADNTLVYTYLEEYDPEYWVWAWKTLMFIKNDSFHVFNVRADGTPDTHRIVFE